MATIDLTNAEVLEYSQEANYIDGNLYQFGRTINLGITAFIKPENAEESVRFQQITNQEKIRLDEIKESGFVDSMSINGQIIRNVKIISFGFQTTEAGIEDHIQLLRVNMDLQYFEAFDNRSNLSSSDPELFKSVDFLQEEYAQYFQAFSESFQFNINDSSEYSFSHSINFTLRKNSPTNINFHEKVKQIALKAFNVTGNSAPNVGFIDDRYAGFIRVVKGNGVFTESHNELTNSYTLTRAVNLKNGVFKDSQKEENWSADSSHSIAIDQSGSVSITESGSVSGRSNIDLETEVSTKKNEDAYENAFQGFKTVKAEAYKRCKAHFDNLIKSKPDWVPGSSEWNQADDLKTKQVSFGTSINRQAGLIDYTITFTNNPRMHNNAIFQYTIEGSRDNQNITTITESGTITAYDENRNIDFDCKTLYDQLTAPQDVIDRVNPLFNSLRLPSSTPRFTHGKNLVSSSVAFHAYGVELTYSFQYSDDPALRDETYLRRLGSSENYQMPVAYRSSVIAPNVKETNYDANQSSEGSKTVTMDCVLKRNPISNKINTAHTDYIKTASSSVLTTLKEEAQKLAYVRSPQVAKNHLSWYPSSMSYSVSSGYSMDFNLEMAFIDKKGVIPGKDRY